MVDVAQLVRALVCGTRGCGFKSHLPPHDFLLSIVWYLHSCYIVIMKNKKLIILFLVIAIAILTIVILYPKSKIQIKLDSKYKSTLFLCGNNGYKGDRREITNILNLDCCNTKNYMDGSWQIPTITSNYFCN